MTGSCAVLLLVILPRWPCVAYSQRGVYSATIAVPLLPTCLSTSPMDPLPTSPPPFELTRLLPQGIHWQEADKLVAVSDKMKSGGKQPFMCMTHDQSIHTFLIPA